MKAALIVGVLCATCVLQASAVGTQLAMQANPVRKIIAMMQNMQGKIEAEGKEKEKMFDAFMCYCNGGDKSLGASVSAAEDKIPQLQSSIKANGGQKAQLEGDVKQAKADRAESERALGKAEAIRNKEQSEGAAAAAEAKSNIGALSKAIPAIEQGAGASFLQSNTGLTDKLRSMSVSMDMEAVDRDLLASFLSDGSSAKGSGEILGILKAMKDEMQKDLAAAVAEERDAVSQYEALVSAKGKERAALTKAIESKTVRVGELAVGTAAEENDLEDTSEALAEDKAMLGNLGQNCEIKKKEWEEFKAMQATELLALADTIKLLNDDQALDLFKKTVPSSASSFMQVQVTSKSMQRRALAVLKAARKGRGHGADPRLDFLEMALHGGQMGFDKIIKMVDGLMTVLKKEQADDDAKKSYCNAEFDKHEDIKKGLAIDISDVNKAIAEGEQNMEAMAKEISDLTAGIKALDQSVAEATRTRKDENANSVATLAANSAAKDLLGMAKNRLNKFYSPKLYKEAPKRELSEEERITVNMGGTLAPTAAPGGIAGTDIMAASFVQVKSQSTHRQPAADLSFKQQGTGVVALIDIIINDVEKESQMLDMEEKEAQREYETFMADAKNKRSLDAKAITDKEGAKASTEAALEDNKASFKDKSTEMVETDKFIMGLHQECDWLLKFHETRAAARSDELEALDKSKAVLSGADYSFLQTASSHLRGSKH